jgi:glucokinase
MAPVGVVDVGGGHVSAGIVIEGRLVEKRVQAIDPDAPLPDLSSALTAPAAELARAASTTLTPPPAAASSPASPPASAPASPSASAPASAPQRWVVALPGPFDYAVGRGTFEGVDKFASLSGVDLRALFASALGVPPASILFVNDAVAYAVGEWAEGAGRDSDRMICVTLGTGVGSAFLAAGRPVFEGDTVPRGGDVHTLTIDGRPLEETVSSPALRARFAALTGHDRTVEQICALSRGGAGADRADRTLERVAGELVESTFSALGRALAPWVRSFGAETVVVGGGIARSWDVVGPPLTAALGRMGGPSARPLEVVPASLGDDAPLLGAARWGHGG